MASPISSVASHDGGNLNGSPSMIGSGRLRCGLLFGHVDARVQHMPLLQGGAQRAMQAILQIELAVPVDHVREQVSEERRVLIEQSSQVERALRGDELVEPNLLRRQQGPVPLAQPVIGVGTRLPHPFEAVSYTHLTL